MLKRVMVSMAMMLLLATVVDVSSASARLPGPPRNPPTPGLAPPIALLIAWILEGAIVYGYARLRKKAARPLIIAIIIANPITVTLLYMFVVVVWMEPIPPIVWRRTLMAELLIWLLEAGFLKVFPRTQLSWKEAIALSFVTNLASFSAGVLVNSLIPPVVMP